MTILLVLSVYAAATSFGLVWVYRNTSRRHSEFDRQVANLVDAPGTLSERADALKALSDIRRNDVPWFERAISSLGVFALITMTIGTAVQTIRAAVEERDAQEWERRANEGEQRLAAADTLIAAIADTLLTKASRVAVLSKDEKRILEYRLDQLSRKEKLDVVERDDLVSASVALREFSKSVAVINRSPALFDAAVPSDQVSLAEYYYLTGDQNRGRSLSDRAVVRRNDMNPQTQMRLIVVRLLLGQHTRADAIREAANTLRLDEVQAQAYLDGDTAAFADGAKRLRESR
jgi:hypothetical protein